MSDLRIIETCACGASIDVTGGRYRNDNYPNNPRGAEEVVERWRVDHKHHIEYRQEREER